MTTSSSPTPRRWPAAAPAAGALAAGILEEHDLGDVSPDSAGTFEIAVEIPAEASPGRYHVEAVAPDGDVVARLPLTVVADSPESDDAASGDDEAGEGGRGPTTPGGEATAEEMEIDHSRSALDWTVILLLLGAAAGVGVSLLRRSAADRSRRPPRTETETDHPRQQRRTT